MSNFIPASYNLPPPPPTSSRSSKSQGRGRGRGRGKFQYGHANRETSVQQTCLNNSGDGNQTGLYASKPFTTSNQPVTGHQNGNSMHFAPAPQFFPNYNVSPNTSVPFAPQPDTTSLTRKPAISRQFPQTSISSNQSQNFPVKHNPDNEKAAQAALAATSTLLYKNNPHVPDKDDPDAPVNLRCENCKVTFDSKFRYDLHVRYHRKCTLCDFKATLQNIREHQFDAHGIGRIFKDNNESTLKPKMNFNLDTPEAIAKWIEDRKKRYPSDANIAKKKAEAERIRAIKAEKRKMDDWGKNDYANKRIHATKNQDDLLDLEVAASAAGVDYKFDVKNPLVSRSEKRIERLYDKVCVKYLPGHCPRGKDCGNRHEGSMICPPLQRAPDAQRVRSRNLRDMLLLNEKTKEKNVILKSFEHIMNKNFFDVITKAALQEAKKRGGSAITEVGRAEMKRRNKKSSSKK
ncbi:7099_t:CDS:2 [Acaulospora morrowiae]|uniref:7099_t:CDS:1 n=1 Tax=Acaulospora morrowiae TaxID=94023 RepID=A0A9N8WPF3_9GLOM|nr:7099_t:CDS:2 [Acaulospora morrowiae]